MSLQIIPGGAGTPSTPAPLPSGLVRMAMADYQKDPALSRSVLDKIAISPAHLQHYLKHGAEDTPALLSGRVLHTLLLEPELAESSVAVFTGARRAGKAWDEFEAASAGKDIVTASEFERLKAMADNARSRPVVRSILEGATLEASVFGVRRGLRVKARPDIIAADGWLWDIKTASDASYAGFQRSAWNFGYHRQAAWYLDVVERATGIAYEGFAMVVLEKEAPYEVALYRMTAEQIARGKAENDDNFELYLKCVTSGKWPGYTSEPQALLLPEWGQ